MDDIHILIRDYSNAVRESFDELLVVYPSFDMRPRGLNIPRSGTLPSGREYSFHGIGCRFEKDGVVTDMDFGPNGRIDGFDAWRLNIFTESKGDAKTTIDLIQASLNSLEKVGEVVKFRSSLCSHLYFPANQDSN